MSRIDYDVANVFNNDRSAIMSRTYYIESNEPSRNFSIYFEIFFVFNIYVLMMK